MEPHETESGRVLPVGSRSSEGFQLSRGGGEGGRRHCDGDQKHRTSTVRGMGEARSPRGRSLPAAAQKAFFTGSMCVVGD